MSWLRRASPAAMGRGRECLGSATRALRKCGRPVATRGAVDDLKHLLEIVAEAALLEQRGRVTFVNDAAGQLFGTLRAGIVGRAVDDLIETSEPPRTDPPQDANAYQPGWILAPDGQRRAVAICTMEIGEGTRKGRIHLMREAHGAGREDVEQSPRALGSLSRRLLEVQEVERRAVSRELYDEIGQSLSAVRVQFAQLRRKNKDDALLAPLGTAERMADHALERVRSLATLLHPPQLETLGLEAALRWHLRNQSDRSGVPISFEIDEAFAQAPDRAAITTFRIVEEAVSNAIRHARADHVDVRVRRQDDGLLIDVVDDGCGFAAQDARGDRSEAQRPGVLAMKERARAMGGQCEVRSGPGIGTTIAARLPWL